MSTVAVSITVVWVLQRPQGAVIVLCLSVGLSLPPLNPLWPWPAGAGMWGAWDSGTAAVLCLIQAPVASLVLLGVAWRRPRPELADA